MTEKFIVYHVTPSWNTSSILDAGIEPARSKGREKVSWYVQKDMLPWALAHCSNRWKISVNNFAVCECWIAPEALTKTRWQGVYKARHTWKPAFVTSASNFLEDEA